MLYFRFSPRFKKRYADLPKEMQLHVDHAIDWKHPGLHVKKLQGYEGIWEARVSQNYRLTFHFEGKYQGMDVCVLRTVGPHNILKKP